LREIFKKDNKVDNIKLKNDISKVQRTDNKIFTDYVKKLIVLDTNVLLSNYDALEKIFSNREYKQYIFIFPWVVIQELDNCKRHMYSKAVNFKAQKAIKLIYHILQSAEKDRENLVFETSMQVYNFIELK
jgi:predicted ribonuclease YlaK